MIRNPHKLADLDAMSLVYYRDLQQTMHLNARIGRCTVPELQPLMNYITRNLIRIITLRPDDLETEGVTLNGMFDQAITGYLATNPVLMNAGGNRITARQQKVNHMKKLWKLEINKIFDYDHTADCFTKIDDGKLAYRHATRLQMNTCTYCNANFTYTIRTGRMKSRPEFDHFLKKSTNPFFALSFFNLVPSCSLCNSGALKGQRVFSVGTHIHPMVDDIEGFYQFRTKVKAVDFLVNGKDFDLEMEPCPGKTQAELKKAERSIAVFGINDRYRFHKDIAGEVIKKAYVYNHSAIENIYNGFQVDGQSIFKSPAEVKELVMGNFLHPDHFHKRALSKMTKDIAEEFGLTI
ncbi:hypothetical protein [Mucilaginibacter rubeus]|uniref:Uncharacterized protein n=1 Tax=Mucilaginibacter rubeus TaxID=2027860 RepID=A0A5C1I476_9SPHI|nr:hypothetical protein [Mucilaginibacter rubeus]QEM12594.1 hypothetical protein DEO27_022125 [Mucilaginibacter rubeus]